MWIENRSKIEGTKLDQQVCSSEFIDYRACSESWMELLRWCLYYPSKHSHFLMGNSPLIQNHSHLLAIPSHLLLHNPFLQVYPTLSAQTILLRFSILLPPHRILLRIYHYLYLCRRNHLIEIWRDIGDTIFSEIEYLWLFL